MPGDLEQHISLVDPHGIGDLRADPSFGLDRFEKINNGFSELNVPEGNAMSDGRVEIVIRPVAHPAERIEVMPGVAHVRVAGIGKTCREVRMRLVRAWDGETALFQELPGNVKGGVIGSTGRRAPFCLGHSIDQGLGHIQEVTGVQEGINCKPS